MKKTPKPTRVKGLSLSGEYRKRDRYAALQKKIAARKDAKA